MTRPPCQTTPATEPALRVLRHFTATTLAASGVGIRTIASRLGHANPGITLRTYVHFLDAADREAASALGLALTGLQPLPAFARLIAIRIR